MIEWHGLDMSWWLIVGAGCRAVSSDLAGLWHDDGARVVYFGTISEAQEVARAMATPEAAAAVVEVKPPAVTVAHEGDGATLYRGDCLAAIPAKVADESVNLVMTSPPYADQRKATYGGIDPDDYVDWFLPRAAELYRVLKPDGSFVLNIKEKVVDTERHTYVMELIIALRRQGWRFTEEYIWHKKNCSPGKWPNRFRDAWERCLHFTKRKKFYMDQDAVMVPMGDWADARLKNLSETDKRRDDSKVKSGFGKRVENWIGREKAYPSNVLHLATECGNRNHSASFPPALPTFFIKLFTRPGDVVLDPFVGSGTTVAAAVRLGRRGVGIDREAEYLTLARARVAGEVAGPTHKANPRPPREPKPGPGLFDGRPAGAL